VARRAGCNAVSLHCPVLTFLTVPGAQYRHVVLPQDIAQLLPKGRLLSEARRPTGMLLYASGPSCLAVAHRRPCWPAERVEGDWRSAEPWLGALRHPPTRASHHALQVGPPRHPSSLSAGLVHSAAPGSGGNRACGAAGGPRTTSRTPAWRCRVPRPWRCCDAAPQAQLVARPPQRCKLGGLAQGTAPQMHR